MCTVTNTKPKLMVASEDLVVYKNVLIEKRTPLLGIIPRGFEILSGIQYKKYKLRKTYRSPLDTFESVAGRFRSGKAFYSWADDFMANVECIIPKGSKYYKCISVLSNRTIYHSDQIKLVRLL